MPHPTLNNPFDRAAIRRMVSRVPPDAINHHAEIAEEATRFLEIVHAQYGEEGVRRFTELVREEAFAMARENATRPGSEQPPRQSGRGIALVILLLLFGLGLLLGVSLRG